MAAAPGRPSPRGSLRGSGKAGPAREPDRGLAEPDRGRLPPLLRQASGINQVQQYLAGIGVDALAATLITRTLLGDESRSLGEAKRTVLTHPARTRELAWHENLMNNLDT